MKTLLIIIFICISAYVFLIYVYPKLHQWCLHIYLSFLPDEKVEEYFVRQYLKYRDNPQDYSDQYVENYIDIVSCSRDYWQHMLEEAQEDRFYVNLPEEIAELNKEIELYQQKSQFWSQAFMTVSNDNAVRKYHASLRNS